MGRRDFRTFKPKGESRKQFTDRVHGEVLAGESIQDLWLTYYENRFAMRIREEGKPDLEPEYVGMLREIFYAGVASMFHLMYVSADGGSSEQEIEDGAAKLERLHNELLTYERGLR